MSITNSEIEERVFEVCEWFSIQKKPCFVKTVRKYDVSKHRVQCRFLGKVLDSNNIESHNKHLNYNKDRVLCVYIDQADNIGLLIRKKTFVMITNSILLNYYSDSFSVFNI